jgi:hypothetical protein
MKLKNSIHLVSAFMASALALFSSLANAEDAAIDLPRGIASAIDLFARGASIVREQEIDSMACNLVPKNPSFVHADFNGDGYEDYAVLLKIKETGRVVYWQGKKLREAKFALVLLLGNGKDGFKPKIASQFTSYIPTATTISILPSGKLHGLDSKKNIEMKNPGVALSFCEKSATAYYISHGQIRAISLVD